MQLKNDLKEILANWPIFLFLIVIGVIAFGNCIKAYKEKNNVDESKKNINERVASHIRVIEYDGHEYLLYENGRVAGITHSGSCKKCW